MSGQPADSLRFGAAGSALGYLALVDYALLAALERMDDEDDFALSLETLDDIVFHHAETDDATEKWQSKHTIESNRTLSDASTDLWKTLRNWIVELDDRNARLVLLAVANAGNAAAKLRAGEGRDVAAALQALERTARESSPPAFYLRRRQRGSGPESSIIGSILVARCRSCKSIRKKKGAFLGLCRAL